MSDCTGGSKLIFACSGAADVGAVADRAARRMSREGLGKMFCIAAVAGRVQPILEQTAKASAILAIDGCPASCVQNTLHQAGFEHFRHFQLEHVGLYKGHTPMSDEAIDKVVAKGKDLLATV